MGTAIPPFSPATPRRRACGADSQYRYILFLEPNAGSGAVAVRGIDVRTIVQEQGYYILMTEIGSCIERGNPKRSPGVKVGLGSEQ